jgi:hypothetical protein
MPERGRYIYCIIQSDGPKSFGPHGIAEGFPDVYTVNHEELAAVVSQSLVTEYPVTREYSMAHQRAIEAVMKEHAVLPVRFSTVADSEEQIMTQVLKPRYEEFKGLLAWIADKQELSVKAHWLDMKAIFQEIAQESEALKTMKAELAGKNPDAAYYDFIEAGEIVEQRLAKKREEDQQKLLAALKPLAVDHRINRVYGEAMVANLAFLIEKAKEEEFHQAVSGFQEELAGRMKLKYIADAPPFNFVTIVIHLERTEHSESQGGAEQTDTSLATHDPLTPTNQHVPP